MDFLFGLLKYKNCFQFLHFNPAEIGSMSGHKVSDSRFDNTYTHIHDVVKLEMVNCLYLFLNPEQELDEKIVNGVWKYAYRLKNLYGKDEKELAIEKREKRMAFLGSFDDYILTQVWKFFFIWY